MKKSFILFAAALLFFACEPVEVPVEVPTDENGNFALYISNQSFEIDLIDVEVYIDEKLAVNDEFQNISGHEYSSFRFSLSEGTHAIKIVSQKGGATLEDTFTIVEAGRGVIHFWYYPEDHMYATEPNFEFIFGPDEPLMID